MTLYWTQLLPGTNGDHEYKLRSYGALLASNKGLLAAAMEARATRPPFDPTPIASSMDMSKQNTHQRFVIYRGDM